MSLYRNNRADILFLLSQSPTESMTLRYITHTLKMPTPAAWSALETLVRDGDVVKQKRGRYVQYRLTSPDLAVRR